MANFVLIRALAIATPSRGPDATRTTREENTSILIEVQTEKAAPSDCQATPQAPSSAPIACESIRILAVGSFTEVSRHPAAAHAATLSRPDHVLIPGLANAHSHLDLTHIGPLDHDPEQGFVPWIDVVRQRRARTPADIAASVRTGVELSRKGGVVAVGDIAGAPDGRPSLAPFEAMRDAGMPGVSYLEFFAMGSRELASREFVRQVVESTLAASSPLTRLGLQPHAPYSVDVRSYEWACALARQHALPLATHLAETAEEREFIARATGPKRQFLEAVGVWNDEILARVGQGKSPVAHLRHALETARQSGLPISLVHLNDITDGDLQILADSAASVVYCPRASTYFGAPARLGPHRYRDMLAAGINVALGTDSIINLPPADLAARGLSVQGDMRLLLERDATPPHILLNMATTHAARALGLPPDWFTLEPGSRPLGILALPARGPFGGPDPLASAIRSCHLPEMLYHRKNCCPAENSAN